MGISESTLTCEHCFSQITKSLGKRAFSDSLLGDIKRLSESDLVAGAPKTGQKLMESDRVNLLGQIALSGIVPCNTCGKGEQCKTSTIHKMRKITNNDSLKISDLQHTDFIENKVICKEITKLAPMIVSAVSSST